MRTWKKLSDFIPQGKNALPTAPAIPPDLHRERHQKLHQDFDELLADFIGDTQALPSKTPILELLKWSYRQTQNEA